MRPCGRFADHLDVHLARRCQGALGLTPLSRGAGEPGLGLRDRGLRQLAGGKAAPRRRNLPLQDLFVGGGELHDPLAAHDVEIGGRRAQQSVLLGRQQLPPLRPDQILRLLDPRRRAASIDRLDHTQIGDAHRPINRLPAARRGLHRRPPVGQGLRHLFVGLAQLRSGRTQSRVALVGGSEGLIERFADGGAGRPA